MQILPLILFGIATAFSPGPNNIMTSYTAFNFGFRKAIPTMLGVIIGWTLLIILLQLTSAAVFEKSEKHTRNGRAPMWSSFSVISRTEHVRGQTPPRLHLRH